VMAVPSFISVKHWIFFHTHRGSSTDHFQFYSSRYVQLHRSHP
jgi:hypothetical protein